MLLAAPPFGEIEVGKLEGTETRALTRFEKELRQIVSGDSRWDGSRAQVLPSMQSKPNILLNHKQDINRCAHVNLWIKSKRKRTRRTRGGGRWDGAGEDGGSSSGGGAVGCAVGEFLALGNAALDCRVTFSSRACLAILLLRIGEAYR